MITLMSADHIIVDAETRMRSTQPEIVVCSVKSIINSLSHPHGSAVFGVGTSVYSAALVVCAGFQVFSTGSTSFAKSFKPRSATS